MGLTRLFMFVLDEELDPPPYPENFQEVEVELPVDYDAVSSDLFNHPNSMNIFTIFNLIPRCLTLQCPQSYHAHEQINCAKAF